MKTFVLYTLARLLLLGAAFGLIWLIFGHWLEWDAISILYTAIIAMVLSSVVALFLLGSLRDEFAAHVSGRATRAKAAYDAMRAAEDEDVAGQEDEAGDVGEASVSPEAHDSPRATDGREP